MDSSFPGSSIKITMEIPPKLNIELSWDPPIPLLEIYSKESQHIIETSLHHVSRDTVHCG